MKDDIIKYTILFILLLQMKVKIRFQSLSEIIFQEIIFQVYQISPNMQYEFNQQRPLY